MDKVSIGARLKESRLLCGMTQEQLAEKVEVNASYISDIERGAKFPSMGLFVKIVDKTGASADYVLRGEIEAGKNCVYDRIMTMLEPLTPKQRANIEKLIATYIEGFE